MPDISAILNDVDSTLLVSYGLDFVTALVILIAGVLGASIAERLIRRGLERRTKVEVTVARFMSKAAKYVILALVFVMVLAQFGVQTTSIIAALGAVGIAVGLALQGTLSNVAAGIMLLVLRPFRIGDYIDASGVAGTVEEIGLFVTELKTFDGIYRVAPNRQIWDTAITNYSRNPSRRMEVAIGISYGDSIETARGLLAELAEKEERFLADPAPQTMVLSLDDSAVTVALRAWVRTDDYWAVLFDTTQAAKIAFDEAGITIPFPQRDIHVFDQAASQAAAE